MGIIPIIWLAVLIAPYTNEGIIVIIEQFSSIMSKPFNFIWCENSLRTILIFLAIYIFGISIYVATRKNYRRREEHGSAQWGNAKSINKKYKQEPFENNKILTQNVSIGLNG